jgi:hypothetical protein
MLYKVFFKLITFGCLSVRRFQVLATGVKETAEIFLANIINMFPRQSYQSSAVYIRPCGMELVVS